MIKLTQLQTHDIKRAANPKQSALADLYIPDFNADSKKAIAKYVIETYDLGELDGVKTTVSQHILDFTYLNGASVSRVTGKITYDE